MAEELRAGGDERRQRRLIDIPDRGMAAADDEIQFVAEVSVVRIGEQVHEERQRGRD